jgi:hypothetical protein
MNPNYLGTIHQTSIIVYCNSVRGEEREREKKERDDETELIN